MAFPAILPRFIIMLRSSISFLFDMPFLSMKKATRTMLHMLFAVTGTFASISLFCFQSLIFFCFFFCSLRERDGRAEKIELGVRRRSGDGRRGVVYKAGYGGGGGRENDGWVHRYLGLFECIF